MALCIHTEIKFEIDNWSFLYVNYYISRGLLFFLFLYTFLMK